MVEVEKYRFWFTKWKRGVIKKKETKSKVNSRDDTEIAGPNS